jgi:xanthine dehydrogenase accessory factor
MSGQVKHLPADAFVVLMTMGHATDYPILLEILKTRDFPYVGIIGSHTKARGLKSQLLEEGLSESDCRRYVCPMGLDIGTNHL